MLGVCRVFGLSCFVQSAAVKTSIMFYQGKQHYKYKEPSRQSIPTKHHKKKPQPEN